MTPTHTLQPTSPFSVISLFLLLTSFSPFIPSFQPSLLPTLPPSFPPFPITTPPPLSQGSPEGLLIRFTAPVNYLAVNDSHSLLAAASSEFSIKIVDLGNPAKVVTLQDHEAPVLFVNFDPKGEFLVSLFLTFDWLETFLLSVWFPWHCVILKVKCQDMKVYVNKWEQSIVRCAASLCKMFF